MADAYLGAPPRPALLGDVAAPVLGKTGEMRAYEPTWRDRLALWLGSVLPEHTTEGLVGSRGLGAVPMGGLIDFTPAGVPLAVQEGDYVGAALGMAPVAVGKIAKRIVRPALSHAKSLPSRSTMLYDPPQTPQRPFEADYPSGSVTDVPGTPLRVDLDGDPLTGARYVVGRRVVGGEDQALPPTELDPLTEALIGRKFEVAPLRGRTIGEYRKRPITAGEWNDLSPHQRSGHTGFVADIWLEKNPKKLEPSDRRKALAHEVGHAVSDRAGTDTILKKGKYRNIPFREIPVSDGMVPELRRIYPDLNGGKMPEDFGYAGDDVRSELMAEAIRASLTNPNYMKAAAPVTYKAIRKAVKNNPHLAKIIRFNAIGGGLLGTGAAGALATDPREAQAAGK